MSVCYVFFKLGNYPQARGTRPDDVDIRHFILSWYGRSKPILVQEFLKGGKMTLKHLKDFTIARIFIDRLKLSPVVKKTVALDLDNSTIVM